MRLNIPFGDLVVRGDELIDLSGVKPLRSGNPNGAELTSPDELVDLLLAELQNGQELRGLIKAGLRLGIHFLLLRKCSPRPLCLPKSRAISRK
jgi:hypothetical protein